MLRDGPCGGRWMALMLAAWLTACGDGGDDRQLEEARRLETEAADLHERGEHDASAEYYARAADKAEAAGDADLALAYRAQTGVCLKMANRFGESRDVLLPVLEQARRRPELQSTLGLALGNLARVEAAEGHVDLALEYMDELAELARSRGKAELEVKTLEQAAAAAGAQGDTRGALERLERALAADAGQAPELQRRDALLRQKAATRALARDDEGAADLWLEAAPSPASMANQARHLIDLGLPARAALVARQAALGFEAEGAERHAERDRALLLELSAMLAAGDLDDCGDLVERLIQPTNDPLAQAPFRIVRGRLAMARGDFDGALTEFRAVRELARKVGAEVADADVAGWLSAVALISSDEAEQALVALEELPASQPRSLLYAWALTRLDDVGSERTGLVPDAIPDPEVPLDDSLNELLRLSPMPVPPWSVIALELHLRDAQERRAVDQLQEANDLVRRGVRAALVWQAIEAVDRVTPGAVVGSAGLARLDRWIAGALAKDEALVAVIPGDTISYLVLCTSDLGATTFGLPPRLTFTNRVNEVVEGLRDPSDGAVTAAGRKLFKLLFSDGALEDLAGRQRWIMIPSDALAAVPPGMLVVRDPLPGEAIPWLVREASLTLLPHALAGTDEVPAARAWAQLDGPAVDLALAPLAGTAIIDGYGRSAVDTTPGRDGGDWPRFTGEAATARVLREQLDGVDVFELDAPAVGGDRLGGVLLAPDRPMAAANTPDEQVTAQTPLPSYDETVGFVPWHRLAELELPATLIMPRARFEPGDPRFGPCHAATAVMRSADRVLLTRWPMPRLPRLMIQSSVAEQLEAGVPLGDALMFAQRSYLTYVEQQVPPEAQAQLSHPRLWAGWLAFGD